MFKPEFLNRIDEIMVFHPLNKKNIEEIAGIMLKTIIRRTKAQVGMSLTVDDGAVAYLAEKGSMRNTAQGRCGGQSRTR